MLAKSPNSKCREGRERGAALPPFSPRFADVLNGDRAGLGGGIRFQADRPLAALHQPRPYSPLWRERAGAGSSLAQSDALRTLRIYGYASAFWLFQPCYIEKIGN